jgi:uncharacterized membrane protein YjfL (UPF0719 family)|tara:strand:- start:3148 stop:3669 length:522 start_codon:yes stop_codon:yes gene_type:complete
MDTNLFNYALLELFTSILIGVILLYLTYRVIEKIFIKKHNIQYNNIAVSIFCSSILFSVGYLISGIKSPILNSLRMIQNQTNYEGNIIFDGFKYTGLFMLIVIITIIIVNITSVYLYTSMTKSVNEFKEIKDGNIAVSLIVSVIVISISIMVKDSLYFLLETFVPYPDVINIY